MQNRNTVHNVSTSIVADDRIKISILMLLQYFQRTNLSIDHHGHISCLSLQHHYPKKFMKHQSEQIIVIYFILLAKT